MNLRVVPAFILFLCSLCRGEILIYEGASRIERSGTQSMSRQSARAFLIVEPNTGSIAKLSCFPLSGNIKVYTLETTEGIQTNQVSVGKTRNLMILAKAEQAT